MCVLPWDVQETWSRVLSSADVRQLQTSPKSEWPHRILRHKRIIKSIKQLKPVAMVKKKHSQWNYMYYVKIALRSASSYNWFSFQRNSRFRQPLKGENVKYSDISRLSFTIFESNRKLKGSFITPRQWPNLESKVLDEWNDHFSEESRLVPSQWIALYRD